MSYFLLSLPLVSFLYLVDCKARFKFVVLQACMDCRDIFALSSCLAILVNFRRIYFYSLVKNHHHAKFPPRKNFSHEFIQRCSLFKEIFIIAIGLLVIIVSMRPFQTDFICCVLIILYRTL